MTVQAITAEILRDRDRVPSSHNVVDCFACGRSFLYEGPHGDDSGRFCHQRCREWFDAGNPPYALISVMAVPIRDWKVIAGPPGVNLGASYYGPILDRKRPLRRGQTEPTELIRPRRPCHVTGPPGRGSSTKYNEQMQNKFRPRAVS